MSTRVYESAIVALPIATLWDAVRPLDFAFLADIKPQDAKAAGPIAGGVVGASRELLYRDGTRQTVRCTEVSDANYTVLYEVVASEPAISYLSAAHTIRLRRVTSGEGAATFVELTSDYSKDASAAVIADSAFKKRDIIAGLRAVKPKAVAGAAGAGDVKAEAGKAADAYRRDTLRGVYTRLVKGGFIGMTEEQFLASPPVKTLLNRAHTPVDVFHKRLAADYPGAHKNYQNELRFDLTPAQLKGLAQEIIDFTSAAMDAVADAKAPLTYAQVLAPLANAERVCSALDSMVTFPKDTADSKELRDASGEQATVLADFYVAVGMREDVYAVVAAYAETKEAKELKGERARFLEHTLRDFRRNGLNLPKAVRDEVKALQSKMAAAGIKFAQNLGEEDTKFEFSAAELTGVPPPLMAQFKKTADGQKYIVSIKYPDYFPVMKLCSVESTRQTLERAFTSRCAKENAVILEDLVKTRAHLAKLLGFENWAAYIQDIRMAKNPKAVAAFLTDLVTKLKPLLAKEQAALRALKAADTKAADEKNVTLHMWDLAYYSRVREEKEFSVNQQEIKEYFPLPVVQKGIFDIYQKLLGLKFAEVKEAHGWHKDVALFDVTDAKTGARVGQFYTDMYPRAGKFGHAACFPLQAGCLDPATGARQLPIAACVCNFAPAVDGKPSLLLHGEVVTFFHEFGHVMHHLCSETDFAHFAGTSVERDFVEAPSQMLENWCWQSEVLDLMSSHVSDGKKLPAATLHKMVAAKDASAGMFNTRQIVFGLFDQTLHTLSDDAAQKPGAVDTAKIFADTWNTLMGLHVTPGTNFAASFGHIAGGYDAQYYGYMWSEVFSMDMFQTRFKAGNKLLDAQSGMDYRKKILAKGSSRDAMDSLIDFLGRKPTSDAFLASKGLGPAPAAK